MSNVVIIEKFLPTSFDDIKKIKEGLKKVKDEWLKVKEGKRGQQTKYIDWDTVRQIIDSATDGITYWDFGIKQQWKEEVYAFNKHTQQWYFDGYVYHVKAYIFIPGLGYREQFGKKVAVGGKDNQDSAYQAAASSALSKCAALFGVGEDLYSSVKIDGEEEEKYYQEMQQNPNYQFGGYPYQQQQQPFTNQQNNYPHQENQFNQFNQGVYPFPQQQQQGSNQQEWNQIMQASQQASQAVQNGSINSNLPFNNADDQEFAPEYSSYQAQIQGEAKIQPFQAQPAQYGAPVINENVSEDVNHSSHLVNHSSTNDASQIEGATKEQETANQLNEWQKNGVDQELRRFANHKIRLNVTDDNQMIVYLRDFFKDEKADMNYLKPDNLKEFNDYLETITV